MRHGHPIAPGEINAAISRPFPAKILIQINGQRPPCATIGVGRRSAMLDLMLVHPIPFAMIIVAATFIVVEVRAYHR
jgi:hypothetical protein